MPSGKNRVFRPKLRKRNNDPVRGYVMRKRECGFSLIELMIVVAIMGILVAVALPQYQNYQVRSKVTEALVLAESVKRTMEVYYADHGEWPVNNAIAGLPAANDLSSTYIKKTEVKSVGSTDCGHFRMKFRNDTGLGKLKKKWLWMKPTVSTDGGSIKWSCAVNSFNRTKDLVPKECRNKPNSAFKSCP